MWKDQYTAEQIALVLMQGALGFEYYMQEEFRLYDLGPDDASRMSKPPEWVNHADRLREWCQERIYALGLGVWEQETFGDQLILDDFRPVAQQLASAPGPESGKVAFLALTTALVLKAFAEYVSGAARELADELRGEVETDLREAWGVDVARGIVKPELAGVHLPQARGGAAMAPAARTAHAGAVAGAVHRGSGRQPHRLSGGTCARPVVPLPGQGLRPVCPPCGPRRVALSEVRVPARLGLVMDGRLVLAAPLG